MARSDRAALGALREARSAPWTAAVAAAAQASDPALAIRPLVAKLGFDGLTSIVLSSASAERERARSVWSTAPAAWTHRYRERAYAAVDPRVTLTARRRSPVIWDAADNRPDARVRYFLADAARFGIRSGFAIAFRDASDTRTVVALDSATSPLTDARGTDLLEILGDLMLIAAALHDQVLSPRCNADVDISSRTQEDALTQRERQCLRMAANGLTSGDIGGKLGIAERTVNFHMCNVLRKLEALNRPEAIANALARGVLTARAIAQRSL